MLITAGAGNIWHIMAVPISRTKLIFLVVIALLGIGLYLFLHAGEETTDDAQLEADIFTVSPKVSGYIKSVNVRDNQQVNTGDLLVEIDPRDYIIRRNHAKAALEAIEASHKAASHNLNATNVSAPSNVEEATAQMNSAKANLDKAVNDLRRIKSLSNAARSREQLDAAIAAEKSTRGAYEDAKARLSTAKTAPQVIASAKSNTESLAAQIKQAQADLDQAEKDLADTKIYAASNGHVTRKTIEPGDYVVPGQQLGYVVSNDMWVVANYKETQITRMKPGNRVAIRIDAFPDLKLSGKIDSIQAGTGARFSQFPPENATGNFVKIVQRIPVKILLDSQPDPKYAIGAGMSVDPVVYTK